MGRERFKNSCLDHPFPGTGKRAVRQKPATVRLPG